MSKLRIYVTLVKYTIRCTIITFVLYVDRPVGKKLW